MRTDIRIDTDRLRLHLDYKDQERRYAEELLEHLQILLALSDETSRPLIRSMIQKAEGISRHCASMSNTMEGICSSFDDASHQIRNILHDYTVRNRSN